MADEVAGHLLQIGAVTLSPRELYTWASGVRSPIYCDNRKVLSFPDVREQVIASWAQLILTRCPDAQVLAGVATAGIPHAALLAEKLHLPMVYVRSEAKDHGLGRAVEGVLPSGSRVVVIEDLISTASSLVGAARQLRATGAKVLAATAIVTYGLPQAEERMNAEGLSWFTLTDLSHLLARARTMGSLNENEILLVQKGMQGVVEQLQSKSREPPKASLPPTSAAGAVGSA
ncbi:MAG: orotate phosphoribosyltransferase [Euryarchaeota archaeon]|nr:orotate phosphoribosyltransferase [Euryarchaeota archaeon]MDE1837098.1 orotate phosphoribosyltransferase [Euryarchaeota archaeon]MDE1879690.1 orotate phosphoribosyltransferase [Euryarchaeota archaeon]MDE2045216.1 orotate phosphoribosyltransferase [Thermoplasmata archaeon]